MSNLGHGQSLFYTLFYFRLRQAVISGGKGYVIVYPGRKELAVRILEDVADFLPHFGQRFFYYGDFFHADRAFVIEVEAYEKLQEGGLANAVGAD